MAEFTTEEEQIAALKKWWSQNGNSLLIGIGLALLVVFGYQAYERSVEQDKAEASLLYQQLINAVTQPSMSSEDEASSVAYIAGKLKENHEGSEYAIYASLFLAKDAVENKDLDTAYNELVNARNATEDVRIKHIVTGRIARVLSAQEKHDDALAELNATDEAFKPNFLEIEGDIQMRKGDVEAAIEAYKSAFSLVKDNPQALPLIAVKLSDLGVNPESL